MAKEVAKAAADQDGAGKTQKFIYTPTGKPQKIIFFNSHCGDATGLTITVTAGDNVFGQADLNRRLKADYAIQINRSICSERWHD